MSINQLRLIWNIVRLRSGPQALPFSYGMLLLLVVLHMLIDIVLSAQALNLSASLISATVNTAFTTGFVFALLQWAGKSKRFVQTLSALLGIEIVIGLIGAVLLFLSQVPALALIVSVMYLLLIVWNGLVTAHILHHALDTSMLWGVVLALLYLFLAYNVVIGFSNLVKGW
jgi:hypothetical protein